MWFVFALGSALFAALTSILAKVGIEGVNSTLATAIRTVVVLAMSWGMVFLTRAQGAWGDRPPELALPHPIGAGHRGVLAVLLPGPAAWPGLSGGAHRQAQRGDHPGAGLCVPPRALYRQKYGGLRPHRRRHPVYGAVRG